MVATVEAPRLTGTVRYANCHVFSPSGTGPSGYSDIYTDVYSDNPGSGSGTFVAAPINGKVTRYTATPYTGQSGPYPPIAHSVFRPLQPHTTTAKLVRTIESFLHVGETLHGDGVTDDSAVFNACVRRAITLAETTSAELVVKLTRTYLCDDTIYVLMWRAAPGSTTKIVPIVPRVGLQFTGPGGTTRTYNGWRQRQIDGDPVEPCWQPELARKLKLQSFSITGFRQAGARGKDKDLEGERGINLESCQDCEVRNVNITNTMCDSVSFGSNPYALDAATKQNRNVRLYGGHWKNSGRLMLEPLCSDLDVYGCLWEINAASVIDVEVTGNPYQPNNPDNGLHRIRIRNVVHHDRDGPHGSFFHIPPIGSGPSGSLGNSPNTFDIEVKECVRYGGPVGFFGGGDFFHNVDPDHTDWTFSGFVWHGNIWSQSQSNLGFMNWGHCRNVNIYDNWGPAVRGSSISLPSLAAQIDLVVLYEDGDRNTPGSNTFTEAEFIARNPGVFVNPAQFDLPVDLS